MNLNSLSALERRDFPASGFDMRMTDKAAGIIEVRANVLEAIDDYDSIFCSPCFDAAVREQRFLPYVLLDHEFPDKLIGRTIETHERRDGGVWQYAKARLNLKKQMTQEALSDIEDGYRDSWSVGFKSDPKAETFERRDGRTVRLIKKLLVWPEFSSVLIPGGANTATLSVRASGLALPLGGAMSAAPYEHRGLLTPVSGGDDDDTRLVTQEADGKPYGAEYAHRPGAGWELRSLHYPIHIWSIADARAHCLAQGAHEFTEALDTPAPLFPGVTSPAPGPAETRSVSDAPWDGASSNYADADAYCRACVLDLNPAGKPKEARNCHLPVREPSGALNRAAVRNALARIDELKVPAAAKAEAARKLETLKREAGIDEGERSAPGAATPENRALDAARLRLRLAGYALQTFGATLPAASAPSTGGQAATTEARHNKLSRSDLGNVQAMHDQAATIHDQAAALGAQHSLDSCGYRSEPDADDAKP